MTVDPRRWCWSVGWSLMLLLWAAQALPTGATGTSYFVSPTGSDNASGSASAPFRTLQQCANVAQAGDTCLIHAGVYRETVTLPRSGQAGSPIVFRPAGDGRVVVSGADILTGWSLSSGRIYRTRMSWDLAVRQSGATPQVTDNQIFLDGQMLVEARWPNVPVASVTHLANSNAAHASGATVTGTSTATYTDPALAGFAAQAWVGARINFLPGWRTVSATCDVTGSMPGSVSFECRPDAGSGGARFDWPDTAEGGKYRPGPGNPYYLWGRLEALDAPGEWFRAADGTLSVWTPAGDSPASHLMEARRRLFAFDVRGRDYISVEGLDFFAAAVATDASTDHLTLQDITARYLWHYQQIPVRWSTTGLYGIFLSGDDNQVLDSTLIGSAGPLLTFRGRRNRVENTVVVDGGYMAYTPVVMASFPDASAGAQRNQLIQNTLYGGGNRLIEAGSGLDIRMNDLSESHLQISDLGVIYAYDTDGLSATIAGNRVHDTQADWNPALNLYGAYGIYLDENTRNYIVERNLVWNTTSAGLFALGTDAGLYPDSNRWFFNNTVRGKVATLVRAGQTLAGTEFRNTYAVASDFANAGEALENNRIEPLVVVDPPWDFRLRADSPAIDGGAVLPGFTDGFVGVRPDVGADEAGLTPSVAGALLRARDLAALQVACWASGSVGAECTLTGLPVGRRLPDDFQIRIGDAGIPSRCETRMDEATHTGTGRCHDVSTGGASEWAPIAIQLEAGAPWQATGAEIDLRALAVTGIQPAAGLDAGGQRVAISGRRFATGHSGYVRPITINNPTGGDLVDYQVRLVLDTAALIAAGHLRSDCADIRLADAYGERPYWIERGCGTATTIVWVRAALLPPGASTLWLRYGAPHAEPGSDGRRTFYFFDDFQDGVIDSSHWDVTTSGWYTFAEVNGYLRLQGTSTPAVQYGRAYLYLKDGDLLLPRDVALDSRVSAVLSPTGFKASLGIKELNLFGSALPKALGYWNGAAWTLAGYSTIAGVPFSEASVSVSVVGPTSARTVTWYENGLWSASRAARSGLAGVDLGVYDFGPDAAASFEVRWDDIRIRAAAAVEPTAVVGAESWEGIRVELGGAPCTDVEVLSGTALTCVTSAHSAGWVTVSILNPDQASAVLPVAFEYRVSRRVYLPEVRR